MESMTKSAQLHFHWTCHGEKISHLCFADDLLIFRGELNVVAMVNVLKNKSFLGCEDSCGLLLVLEE